MTEAMPERKVRAITTLRMLLGIAVLIAIPFAYVGGEEGSLWAIFSGYVMPALVVLLSWGVLLDMLMIMVFRAARQAGDPEPYLFALLFDAALLMVLVVSWGPFYLELLQ